MGTDLCRPPIYDRFLFIRSNSRTLLSVRDIVLPHFSKIDCCGKMPSSAPHMDKSIRFFFSLYFRYLHLSGAFLALLFSRYRSTHIRYQPDRNSVLLSKSIGQSLPVVPHGKNYYKTTKECNHFILIHQKDCILLQG